jgi:putative IMPACT (imprinted ancient) family translation regulator
MEEKAAVKFIENRSRFFAHLYEISDLSEIDEILKLHRRKYRKANHHCYAARFTKEGGHLKEIHKDDGEVGHPGRVLLELMSRKGLESHVLIVSRIFGGIKLGVGGVSRAFRDAGKGAVEVFRGQEG